MIWGTGGVNAAIVPNARAFAYITVCADGYGEAPPEATASLVPVRPLRFP